MEGQALKVGVISCSGEDLCEGTISRLAARKVLEELRPGRTVTLCLPLFLAGGEGERAFAKAYPTITVDGCAKACAKRGTEMHSGPVGAALIVSDLLGEAGIGTSGETSARRLNENDAAAVALVAERLAREVDRFGRPIVQELADEPAAECECMRALPSGEIVVDGRTVVTTALPLIFQRMADAGLKADDACGPRLLAVTKIYHQIVPAEEPLFQAALAQAYRDYCASRS